MTLCLLSMALTAGACTGGHSQADRTASPTRPSLPDRYLVSPEPSALAPHLLPIFRAQTDGSRLLRVEFGTRARACERLDRVEVKERQDAVEIRLFVGGEPTNVDAEGKAGVCHDIGISHATDVRLSAPLAGRTVVDGFSGDAVMVTAMVTGSATASASS